MRFAMSRLAQDLLLAAIMADFARRLPFWQYPSFMGVFGICPPTLGGSTPTNPNV